MADSSQKTEFASPERSSLQELQTQRIAIEKRLLLVEAFNAIPEIVLILNQNRQIIFCNKVLLEFFKLGIDDVFGKRPGEALNCIYAHINEAGCGTSRFCKECGAVRSILLAQKGEANQQECRITARNGDQEMHFDLKINSVPVNVEKETFTVFTIQDIASVKRREALERTFFHDVINDVFILQGYMDNMVDGVFEMSKEYVSSVRNIAKRVMDNINSHRLLLAAENGTLGVHKEEFPVRRFLEDLILSYQKSEFGKDKIFLLNEINPNETIRTDQTLLERIVGNMIKNALEAASQGSKITITYQHKGPKKIFSVQNPEVMPESVQLQVFQRSFSTKGKGRGIGTYSIKFLTENFLKGKAYFNSTVENGTTFFAEFEEK